MVEKPPYYRVYLLTVWKEDHQHASQGVWRFHLEDPHTGQRRAFASATALVAALQSGFIGTEETANEPSAPA